MHAGYNTDAGLPPAPQWDSGSPGDTEFAQVTGEAEPAGPWSTSRASVWRQVGLGILGGSLNREAPPWVRWTEKVRGQVLALLSTPGDFLHTCPLDYLQF